MWETYIGSFFSCTQCTDFSFLLPFLLSLHNNRLYSPYLTFSNRKINENWRRSKRKTVQKKTKKYLRCQDNNKKTPLIISGEQQKKFKEEKKTKIQNIPNPDLKIDTKVLVFCYTRRIFSRKMELKLNRELPNFLTDYKTELNYWVWSASSTT